MVIVELEDNMQIGHAPERSRIAPYFIKSTNGLKSGFKTLEKLRYELRNTWNYASAEKVTRELRDKISEAVNGSTNNG
jgi:hypothetical protein